MIRTVHIITDLSTGGAQMMLYKLLASIDRSHFEPIVICLMDKDVIGKKIETLDIPVYTVNMSQGKLSISALWRLIKLVRASVPDVIQGWMYHGNIAAIIGRIFCFKKVALLWNIRHSVYDLKYEKKYTAQIIRIGAICSKMAIKIIYNSSKSAEQHEELGYTVDRTVVIPNGFDCLRFKPSSVARIAMRKELTIKENDIVIGLIGRYHPMKDHDNFFKAAGILIRIYSNVCFVLAGPGVDDSNAEISKAIRQHRIEEKIRLLGDRKDTPVINAGLDIACSSSYGEAFSNVIGEAMACGVPCVVTDVGDSAWIVGDTGKVVPPRNPEALAKAWSFLIEAGPEERNRLGDKARQRILENFTLDKIVQEYERLYESVNYQ